MIVLTHSPHKKPLQKWLFDQSRKNSSYEVVKRLVCYVKWLEKSLLKKNLTRTSAFSNESFVCIKVYYIGIFNAQYALYLLYPKLRRNCAKVAALSLFKWPVGMRTKKVQTTKKFIRGGRISSMRGAQRSRVSACFTFEGYCRATNTLILQLTLSDIRLLMYI